MLKSGILYSSQSIILVIFYFITMTLFWVIMTNSYPKKNYYPINTRLVVKFQSNWRYFIYPWILRYNSWWFLFCLKSNNSHIMWTIFSNKKIFLLISIDHDIFSCLDRFILNNQFHRFISLGQSVECFQLFKDNHAFKKQIRFTLELLNENIK